MKRIFRCNTSPERFYVLAEHLRVQRYSLRHSHEEAIVAIPMASWSRAYPGDIACLENPLYYTEVTSSGSSLYSKPPETNHKIGAPKGRLP